MKAIIIVLFISMASSLSAQKYISKNGQISFFSHTPLEDIEAQNNQAASILDVSNGDLVINVLVKSFVFKKALMQEHFNENYMESDKFPKATFKGKITNLSTINFKKDGSYPAEVAGDLTIHGETKQITQKGSLSVKGNSITITSSFPLVPQDYAIKIPGLVENKIAKEIETKVDITYNPYQ
jgi:polyisoprenoid-binding protein YceI